MRIFTPLLALMVCVLYCASAHAADLEKFVIYYSDKAPIESFKPYQLVVLDSTHHPSVQALKESGKTVLGYISVGEVEMSGPWYSNLKNHDLILQENKNWKGSYFIDLRDPLWPKTVIEEIIPSVLRQGFDGIFLDTLDNPLELEDSNPGKYKGMSEAAAHLVEGIRLHYPSIKIMVNRAYSMLPEIGPSINMELGESIYADYNFDTKSYGKVKATEYHEQVKMLQGAQKNNPQLKIYTLDYAKPTDTKSIAEIYQTERANGFVPYVATIGLDQLVDEPGSH